MNLFCSRHIKFGWSNAGTGYISRFYFILWRDASLCSNSSVGYLPKRNNPLKDCLQITYESKIHDDYILYIGKFSICYCSCEPNEDAWVDDNWVFCISTCKHWFIWQFFHCFVTVTVFSLTNSVSWFSEEFIDECDDEGKELDPKKSGQLLNEEQVQEWDMMIEEEQSPYHANAEILMTKYDHRVL